MNFDLIPQELQDIPHWCCWRYEDRGNCKPTKVPINPSSGNYASISKLDSWSSFSTARFYSHLYDGTGFVLTPDDPYTFIDLDYTQDPAEIALQKQIFENFPSYAERSPSGKGLHIICRGSVPQGRRMGSVEIYSDARYLCMTGDVYRDAPIIDCQTQLTSLWGHLGSRQVIPVKAIDQTQTRDDKAIYDAAAEATNGQKFLDLWEGRFDMHYAGDQSRADFALIDMLAFYSDNKEQIKRMFRMSALGQRTKANRQDYVDKMVDSSFDRKLPEIDFSSIRRRVEEHKAANIAATAIAEQITAEPSNLDDCIFEVPPGLTGQITKFLFDSAWKPVHEIAMTGAIALMAGLCGRAYNVDGEGLNLYLLLLAGTGRGKEAISKGIGKLIAHVAPTMPTLGEFIGPARFTSGQAILKTLNESKTKSFVSIFGEFGITLKLMANSKFENDQIKRQIFLDLFAKSGAASVVNSGAYADSFKNIPNIHNPSFSFVGESVPDEFYDSIDEKMISTGLLPRFITVEYLGKRNPSNYNHDFVIPSKEFLESLCNLATTVYRILENKQTINISFDTEAFELDRAFDKKIDLQINRESNEILAQLWNRSHLKIRRLAGLLAVGKNPYNVVIDRECWEWAEKFVCHSTEKLVGKFMTGQVGACASEHNQLMAMRSFITCYRTLNFEEMKRLHVPIDLQSRGIMLHSHVMKLARERCFAEDFHGGSSAIKKVLQILIDSGELQEISKSQMRIEFNSQSKGYLLLNQNHSADA